LPNRFRDALLSGEFAVSCEVVPGRGAREDSQLAEFSEAQRIHATGRVHAVSVTDNPSGHAALFADAFAAELMAAGITPLVHLTCKDRSRNQLQSQLYALERQGVSNVLVMTGDYPASGWSGLSKPVFDLDPVQLLKLITQMNAGLPCATRTSAPTGGDPATVRCEKPAHFFAGVVVSPFKWTEAETITQYVKLDKKIHAGAQFIISQLGFDARKMQELLWYLREKGHALPVIANVFILNAGIGRLMSAGKFPGCYVSDALLDELALESTHPDKGKRARLERAAAQIAIARGLGYAGVHIGGLGLNAQTVVQVLDRAQELQTDWQSLAQGMNYGHPDGFYLYLPESGEKSSGPTANEDQSNLPATAIDPQPTAPQPASSRPTGRPEADQPPDCDRPDRPRPSPRNELRHERALFKGYGLSRFFHYWVLTKDKRGYPLLSRIMDRKERKRGRQRKHTFEHLGKAFLYGCQDCGDCGLEATVFSCPMAECPKCQRNGPCGGSFLGWCEVYPHERYCVHFKAYHRLKKHDELAALGSYLTPASDWNLDKTSAWSNYTHERDNAAKREPLDPVQAIRMSTEASEAIPDKQQHEEDR
jgi:methylenetetrahydrofolate reductase (NADPH)